MEDGVYDRVVKRTRDGERKETKEHRPLSLSLWPSLSLALSSLSLSIGFQMLSNWILISEVFLYKRFKFVSQRERENRDTEGERKMGALSIFVSLSLSRSLQLSTALHTHP
jgi:hypothetical protein